MKNSKILTTVSGKMSKLGFGFKKHSPEILVITGIVGVVASAVLACKETTKAGAILDKVKEDLDKIHKCAESEDLKEKYSEQDKRKDLAIVYAQTGIKLFKLYAPSVICMTVSITSILVGHDILRKRNLALATAYATVDKSFKEYRSRVKEKFGEDVDTELKHGIKAKIFEKTETDEDNHQKTILENANISEYDGYSGYARFFDEASRNWEKDSDYNLMFLRSQQAYANDLLKARGHLFLNEVYDMLDIPRTKAGQVVGWLYKPDDADSGDNYVDFGIYDINREKVRDFVNGYERSILLDFNVDGYIWDKI